MVSKVKRTTISVENDVLKRLKDMVSPGLRVSPGQRISFLLGFYENHKGDVKNEFRRIN